MSDVASPPPAEASHELLTTFYPTLSALMLDAMLRQEEGGEAEGGETTAATADGLGGEAGELSKLPSAAARH